MVDEPPSDEPTTDEPTTDEPPGDGPRVPPIAERGRLPEDQRHHFDAIAESRGGVRGPFGVLLHVPELAGRVADLGAYVRFEGELPGTIRELAVLATAYEWDCAYEWAAHEPIAREEGVEPAAIDAASGRSSPGELAEPAATVVRYVRELLREHDVTEETFRAATEYFGDRGVIELTATVGYYSMLACVLDALRVVPDGSPPF